MLEILGGCTIALGILLTLLQCLTCNFCGLGGILDGIFALAGGAVWLAAAILVQDARNDLNGASPNDTYNSRRNTIAAMVWVEFILFALIFICALLKCCCCCCRGGKGDKEVDAEEVVAALLEKIVSKYR